MWGFIFFNLKRWGFIFFQNLRRWGFIFFRNFRVSRGVLFFSDFDFGKVISGFNFFQILELGVLFFSDFELGVLFFSDFPARKVAQI